MKYTNLYESNFKRKYLTLHTLLYFLIGFIIFIAIFYFYTYIQIKNEREVIELKQKGQIQLLKSDIRFKLEDTGADILFLKDLNILKEYLDEPGRGKLAEVENEFSQFASNKIEYDQIRLLSLNGKELIRINNDNGYVNIVNENDLQDKGNRYYYKEATKLENNKIYISPLDLNVENGNIEKPRKPMIRFITPVYNNGGIKSGYLVMNYLADRILKEIKEYNTYNEEFKFLLLNSKGYFLFNSDGKYEFAFMYDREEERISVMYPNLWRHILNDDNEYINYDGNTYYFTTILPKLLINNDNSQNYFWKLGIAYNNERFTLAGWIDETNSHLLIYICIIMILILSFIFSNVRYYRRLDEFKIHMLGTIISDAKEAIIITDKDTKILYTNEAFGKITGFENNEAIGKYPSNFKSGKHDRNFYKEMWNSINTKGFWIGEIWDKKKNGDLYIKSLNIRYVETNIGEKYYIGIFSDLTSIKEKEKNLERLKNYDLNTNLPNYVRLIETLENHIISRKETILIVIKLKNFNALNNNLGSKIGNLLLKQAAINIKKCLLEDDKIFKSDKDEFAIVTENKYDEVFDKSINELNKLFNMSVNAETYKVYFQIVGGISIVDDYNKNGEFYIQNARIAMFKAENDNKGNFITYSPQLRDYYNKILKIQMLLKTAVANKEFILYYQPQVTINDEKVIGAEALIRWNNKELGFVSPGEFISIAEQDDTIISINNWVIEEACKQKKEWNKIGVNGFTVSINITPNHFLKTDLYSYLKTMLTKYELTGQEIEIEITEDLLITDNKAISNDLIKIKTLGIKIAVDDFGTGYSSLQYLKELPIDKLKIDRKFIKDIPDKDNGTIAKIIVDLAYRLNIEVIAEGIETETQKNFIKGTRCDEIQGYYYSKPLEPDNFIEWLGDHNNNAL